MRKFFLTMILVAVAAAGCSADNSISNTIEGAENILNGNTKTLIAYFSAEGHTKAVAEAIQKETGADIFFIEPENPYAINPYDDSDRIQNEAYNDLRPDVKGYLTDEQMAKYDIIFVGTPCWWHQPAMVVCTFLEHYNLSNKVIIPFVTYGARTYLNETMQKIYRCTPESRHIPVSLPEDIDPENIRQPQNDDDGIDMPTVSTVKQWLDRIDYFKLNAGVDKVAVANSPRNIYSIDGMMLLNVPNHGFYIADGKKFYAN